MKEKIKNNKKIKLKKCNAKYMSKKYVKENNNLKNY